ncbi:hypothetical protein TNCV_925081 [Trichonephila clavipes]|nr:hypothetical protein TNCV_925081 [Trichonephila clavipes]
MAERSKALLSGRSPLAWAWVKIPEWFKRCVQVAVKFCGRAPIKTATAGSDVVQSGRPIFDNFFQHLWPYIGNNTANVVFQMVKRLWPIRIDQ